jgi:hypothetical protein
VAWGGIEDFKPRRDLLKWCCEDKSCFSDIETARKLKPNIQTRKKKKNPRFLSSLFRKKKPTLWYKMVWNSGQTGVNSSQILTLKA